VLSVFLPVFLAFFAACSNPLLKWIDTDNANSGGGGRAVLDSEKEIRDFSFGIQGETDEIRLGPPVPNGKTPITVVLPAGTNKINLSPAITINGKSVSPASGTAQNFNSPVTYRVTAQDTSWREYEVEVIVKTPESAEIIWFDLKLPESGANIMAEGSVTEGSGGQPGNIVISVPYGTNLANLRANIVQTGKSLTAPNAINTQAFSGTAVTLTGNFEHFSAGVPADDRIYTVESEDGLSRDYVVTVVVDKSSAKEITAFSFGYGKNETVIIGTEPQDGKYLIVATVPVSGDLTKLTPKIAYKGASISGLGIPPNTRTENFDNPSDPIEDPNQNFEAPHTYTVAAEDDSVRDYEVWVYQSSLNTDKQITGFYVSLPNTTVAGIINETAKTIAVTVPPGTVLTSLRPTVYHTGASIYPLSGEPRNFAGSEKTPAPYTVTARDGSSQTYRVSVFVAKSGDKGIGGFDFTNVSGDTAVIGSVPDSSGNIPIVVTVPSNTEIEHLDPQITHGGTSVTGYGGLEGGPGTASGSNFDFSGGGPFIYTVEAEDGSSQNYSVTVVKTPDPTDPINKATIDGFYFNNPMAVGVINQDDKTLTVTVPAGTELSYLIPTIYFTGLKIENDEEPGTAQETHPASIPADFSSPVDYKVTAQDDSTTETYRVTVGFGPEPPSSDVREITFVSFDEVNDVDLTTVISPVPDTSGVYPVEVIVPAKNRHGNDIAPGFLLTPVILYKDKDAAIGSISGGENFGAPESHPTDSEINGVIAGSTVSFASPRTYTVTAENGGESKYEVTVRIDDNNLKEITAFYFTSPMAVGVIDEADKTITVTVPHGTSLAGLVPTVSYNGASLDPASGRGVNFSSPATYTVTARNGTVQPYTVRVIPKLSSVKEITAISFPGAGVLETVIGGIPDPAGHIPVSITVSGQTNIAALAPAITYTGASITPPGGTTPQPAGSMPFVDSVRDFRTPQVYRITAEDGSARDYEVSVHVSGNGAAVITGFVFKSVPLFGGGTVSVVGQINQDAHSIENTRSIEVRVPHTAVITDGLEPTITYLGKSLSYSTTLGVSSQVNTNPGSAGQSCTYKDAVRPFASGNHYYVVNAEDGSTCSYKVTIVKIPEITISYGSLRDDKFITESFDQNTGLLTIRIDTTTSFPLSDPDPGYKYETPFGWYVDGVEYPVSDTQDTLVIKTADFSPGRHQITVSAKRTSDNKHYTNLMYFVVQD
jgi:hypothetical protein